MNSKHSPKIKKLLIANRGEVACRILRTCRKMNIDAVTIYTEEDRNSLHVLLANEAYEIPSSTQPEAYSNIEAILAIAQKANVSAIHPGYGFLSESAEFAQKTKDRGFIFIGPTPENISQMGDKIQARQLMEECGVPTSSGTRNITSLHEAKELAKELKYPVLLKSSSGGGGKGIYIAKDESEIENAFNLCFSYATKFFKSQDIFLEKYIKYGKHIEVQIARDNYNNTVHFFDRDCSCQRKYQKILEEAPASSVPQEVREALFKLSCKAANYINYRGIGTFEFLFDIKTHNVYFLEMNTRLQVEHPVTEMITGIDLVRLQIEISEGKEIPFKQSDIPCNGYALESRICAEDSKNFSPSPGTIHTCRHPQAPFIRVDSCAYPGVKIPIQYDSLLGKIISWGRTREQAAKRLEVALQELMITGVKTNQILHKHILSSPTFKKGNYTTEYVEKIANSSNRKDFFKYVKDDIFILATAIHHYENLKKKNLKSRTKISKWKTLKIKKELDSRN